jgi:Spy/CpxP family protein refolding chaperone
MAQVLQKLNLTDEQKQQFRQIRQEWMKQARAIHNDSSLTETQKREKMQALRKQHHKQIFKMLTPEQKETLKQLREQHQKEMQEKRQGSAGQASANPNSTRQDDDDPFAGMTSDDDGPGM